MPITARAQTAPEKRKVNVATASLGLPYLPLIIAQQVFVFVRLLIKVGYYAAISEALTRLPEPEYSYVAGDAGGAPRAASSAPAANEVPLDGV